MWMLMEGVVLYVKLVMVFIKHHKRYIAAFTVASYGKLLSVKLHILDQCFYCRYSISIHRYCCSSRLLGQY